jgi:uncharacterized membrane protein
LWLDEANIYWFAQGPLTQIIEQNTAHNSAPPLFVLLIALVTKLGTSELALRLLPCLAGIALIPAVYLLTRRQVEQPWALVAAALVAISPTQVLYSQQLREYSLAALMAVLLIHATLTFLDQPGMRPAWRLAVVTIIALCTQYGLGLLVATLGLYGMYHLATSRQSWEVWRHWILVQLIGLVCVVALVNFGLAEQLESGKGGVLHRASYLKAGYWAPAEESLRWFVQSRTSDLIPFAFPGAAFLVLFVTGFLAAGIKRAYRPIAIVFSVSMLVAVGAALLHAYPYGPMRQSIFLTPMFYVIAAIGAATIGAGPSRLVSALAVGLLVVASSLSALRQYYRWIGEEPLRPLLAVYAQARAQGDELYVSQRARAAVRYYTRDDAMPFHSGVGTRQEPRLADQQQLDSLIQRPGRLWLLFSDLSYEHASVLLERIPPGARLDTVQLLGRSGLFLAM